MKPLEMDIDDIKESNLKVNTDCCDDRTRGKAKAAKTGDWIAQHKDQTEDEIENKGSGCSIDLGVQNTLS